MKKGTLGEEIRKTQKNNGPVNTTKPVLGKYVTGQEDPRKRDYLRKVSKLRRILLLINTIIVLIILMFLIALKN